MAETDTTKAMKRYKAILQRVLETRPSGTRQRLATVLGTNRSFVSQISSPAYKVPVPSHHVDTILEVCHFSPADRADFLAAYAEAHPDQQRTTAERMGRRVISVSVPDLGNARSNRLLDEAIRGTVRSMTRILLDKGSNTGRTG